MRHWEDEVRILVVPNTTNPRALESAVELVAWCSGAGMEPVLAIEDARAAGLEGFAVAPSELGEPVLVVALGGDGTILKAVHLIGDRETPVLGVNLGRLGFLSGARAESMREAITSALAGEGRIERRATLSVEVTMGGRRVGTYRALNEVVLSRGDSGRVVEFEITIGGHRVWNARADGVIVATATGSTAYALSAGGPVVAPGFAGMLVVPVAPHTLRARPVLTGPEETIEVALSDSSRGDAHVVVDGSPLPRRQSIDRLAVSRGSHDVMLVKLGGRDFYETVAEEFFGCR